MKHLITLTMLFMLAVTSIQAQKFKGLDKSPLDMIEFPSSNRETNKLARVLYKLPQRFGLNGSECLQLQTLFQTQY